MNFIRLTSENGRPTLVNLALVTDVRPASGHLASGSELYLSLFAPNGDQVFIEVLESFQELERRMGAEYSQDIPDR